MDTYRKRAELAGAAFIDLANVNFTARLLRCIPAELIRRHRVLPVTEADNQITIAVSDPADLDLVEQLQLSCRRDIEVCVADASQLDSFIERLYGEGELPG